MDGILLVGNGQADEETKAHLLRLSADIKDNTDISVVQVVCVKQLQPDLAAAVLSCVKQGVTRLYVIPRLLAEPLLGEAEQVVQNEVDSFRGMRMRLITDDGDDSSLLKTVQECLSEAWEEQKSV